jgi:hypothetical protein
MLALSTFRGITILITWCSLWIQCEYSLTCQDEENAVFQQLRVRRGWRSSHVPCRERQRCFQRRPNYAQTRMNFLLSVLSVAANNAACHSRRSTDEIEQQWPAPTAACPCISLFAMTTFSSRMLHADVCIEEIQLKVDMEWARSMI